MLNIPQHVKHVLVAPLNWGLGHASRSIVIIESLIKRNLKVTVASDGDALSFLSQEFPMLKHLELPSYNVRYNGSNFLFNFLQNGPKILSAISKERKVVEELVSQHDIDMVISDSRFGLNISSIPTAIITHQLKLKAPNKALAQLANITNKRLLKSFDEIWVPDYPNQLLSGTLSDKEEFENVKYIGPLSNLTKKETEKLNQIAIILSGPEPARTILEDKIYAQLDGYQNVILVRGSESLSPLQNKNGWQIIDLASRERINSILLQSKLIISRSGYSSIMDYDCLNIGAILIPTPGQTEQEYLAESMKEKMDFYCILEKDIASINKIIDRQLSLKD